MKRSNSKASAFSPRLLSTCFSSLAVTRPPGNSLFTPIFFHLIGMASNLVAMASACFHSFTSFPSFLDFCFHQDTFVTVKDREGLLQLLATNFSGSRKCLFSAISALFVVFQFFYHLKIESFSALFSSTESMS